MPGALQSKPADVKIDTFRPPRPLGLTLEVLVPGALQSKPADVKIDAFSSLRDLF